LLLTQRSRWQRLKPGQQRDGAVNPLLPADARGIKAAALLDM